MTMGFALFHGASGGDSEGRKEKPVINYQEPRREFQTVKKGRWSFEVEKELLDQAPAVANRALSRLQANVDEAFRLLPKPAHPALLELKWFVLYGPKARGGGLGNGLEYCGRNAPIFRPNLDDRFARCILVHCAENYAGLSDLWALKAVLHELGHAHHKENWPEKQADIMAAWRNAVDKGLYRNVRDDRGRIRPRVYALANQLEYFAELTAIYFARCDYAPFDRAGLRLYDPVGYAMIEKMWGLSKDEPPLPGPLATGHPARMM
ncbi:MAG: hypothetical protein N2689_10725 [Verrucomicrobiae bacterium]|nr:hypothetical protein [Verrucomicrobiae bacterium]